MEAPQQETEPKASPSAAERWRTGRGALDLSERPLVVAVVNATPDSFSDRAADRSTGARLERVDAQLEAGADLIEVGGESNVSNRPAVDAATEIGRIVPVVEAAVARGATVSIDTYKPAVAAAAIDAGAAIVNDISGFADPEMAALCAARGAGVVLMHTITPPKTSLWDEGAYGADGVADAVIAWLLDGVERLEGGGIARESICLDPGVDFGKTPAQSVELMRSFDRIAALGLPVMSAVSRKDFVGALTARRPSERLAGTLAAVGWAVLAGARVVRAHDVAETRDFLAVLGALSGESEVDPALRVDESIRREPAA